MRIAAGIEYDGRRFRGWQSQPDERCVQDVVEAALAQVADAPVRLHCAGRTDTGVHALGQVVHFDADVERPERAWVLGANTALPNDVGVLWARRVPDAFHARFSATRRRYRYLILDRSARSALLAGRVTWIHRPLEAGKMAEAAQALIGTHDFTSFRAIGCQAKHPVRTVTELSVRRHGALIEIAVSANAFLHHMVRNVVGVLIAIGRGDAPVGWAREVLERRDRTAGGVTAMPDGLYLERIDYPAAFGLPAAPTGYGLAL
ncbi:MAG: tRNA pseudouridine(38-40) synthase TruA [Gemmatimonadales bacterium]|jgi:tRNA pseudouridine38-40 synthase|nr:tRNA pseudouridine(38-40) synthase TruA [Gemmatimonadales bacterium]